MTSAVSTSQNEPEISGLLSDDMAFRLYCFNRDWFAMSMLKYRDFQSNAAQSPEKLSRHFKMPLTAADFAAGAAAGTKEYMARHQDPAIAAQPLCADGKGDTVFSDADKAFLQNMLDRHLKHDFGYDLLPQQRGFSGKAKG